MERPNPSLSADEVIARIHAEVERRRAGTAAAGTPPASEMPESKSAASPAVPLAWTRPLKLQPRFQPRAGDRYALRELLDYHDVEFVTNAYRALLGRWPDPVGLRHYLAELRSGRASKVDLLGRLRFSPEGRRRRVRVQWLLPRFAFERACRLPVAGYALRWLAGLAGLPRLARHHAHFEAYSLFLLETLAAEFETRLRAAEPLAQRLADAEQRLRGLTAHVDGVNGRAVAEERAREGLAGRIDAAVETLRDRGTALDAEIAALRGMLEAESTALLGTLEAQGAALRGTAEAQSAALRGTLEALHGTLEAESAALRSALGTEVSALRAALASGDHALAQHRDRLERHEDAIAQQQRAAAEQGEALTRTDAVLAQLARELGAPAELHTRLARTLERLNAHDERTLELGQRAEQLHAELAAELRARAEASDAETRARAGEAGELRARVAELSGVLDGERDLALQLSRSVEVLGTRLTPLEQGLVGERAAREALSGGVTQRLEVLERDLQQLDSAALHRELTEAGARIGTLAAELGAESRSRGELEQRFDGAERRLDRLRVEVVQSQARLGLLLEEARRRLPEPFDEEQLGELAAEAQHALDALYVAFEDQFRGSREDVRERLRIYLPMIREASAGTPAAPVLDVACGRGEWLELLRQGNLVARGVDLNRALVESCRRMDLEVVEADLIEYLRKLPSASLGAVTGFHVVEHLPIERLIQLLDETVRVLVPGGIAIFETPNPGNLLVGAHTFYLDPTHLRPLPSPMLHFLVEARGLVRVEVRELHPYPKSEHIRSKDAVAQRVNEVLYGPRDYAVIGHKA